TPPPATAAAVAVARPRADVNDEVGPLPTHPVDDRLLDTQSRSEYTCQPHAAPPPWCLAEDPRVLRSGVAAISGRPTAVSVPAQCAGGRLPAPPVDRVKGRRRRPRAARRALDAVRRRCYLPR